jgi:hypothetical protein
MTPVRTPRPGRTGEASRVAAKAPAGLKTTRSDVRAAPTKEDMGVARRPKRVDIRIPELSAPTRVIHHSQEEHVHEDPTPL